MRAIISRPRFCSGQNSMTHQAGLSGSDQNDAAVLMGTSAPTTPWQKLTKMFEGVVPGGRESGTILADLAGWNKRLSSTS